MTELARPSNAYTDAPPLHPNLLAGSMQILAWLFLRPAAWRSHVARIDPALRPDFALIDLQRAQWRNPLLRRLVFQTLGPWSALVVVAIGVAVALAGRDAAALDLMSSALIAIVLLGIVIPLGPFVAGMLIGGALFTPMLILNAPWSYSTAAACIGVMGGVLGQLIPPAESASPNRHVGALIVAVLVALLTTISVPGLLVVVYLLPTQIGRSLVLALWLGLACGGTFALRTRRWVPGLYVGAAVGLLVGTSNSVVDLLYEGPSGMIAAILYGGSYGVVFGTSFSGAFTIAARLAERAAGRWAGNIAGMLGFAGMYELTLLAGGAPMSLWTPLVSGISLGLGFSIGWWRPLLLYPGQAAWNTVLFHADERRKSGPWWLRRHAVFWDELQRLPFAGLDRHLVLVAERDPAEGQVAIEFVAQGRQRWAAQAAQIELDARQLERCADVAAIGMVARQLAAGDLSGPASALLRSLSRIGQDVAAALAHTNLYHQRLGLHATEEHLDSLLRELTRSGERYAARFRPIAALWRRLIADRLQTLAAEIEQRQEIVSPYIVGVPLTAQQAIFIGRTDISARIEQLLRADQCPPLLLYGQRRMGKTSLLNNLGRLLPRTIVPLFVDLQGPIAQAQNHAGLLAALARAMIRSAQRQSGLSLPALSFEDLERDPFPCFDAWIDTVEEVLGNQTALLALDEFEALNRAFTAGRFSMDDVLGALRHLIQHRPRFKVLLAGSHTFDEVRHWASYLINVQVIPIGYLSEAETYQLVEHPVRDFAVRYAEDALQHVFALTNGHPALVQLLCAEIIAYKNTQLPTQRRFICRADVEAAVPEALRHGSFFFADIEHNQLEAVSADLLRFIAAQGTAAVVTQGCLARQFPGDLDQALIPLSRRGLIEPVRDGYRIQVELIRRWFAPGAR